MAGGSPGPIVTDGGLRFPQSRFVAATTFTLPTSPIAASFATVREPADAGTSVLEAWSPQLSEVGSRTLSWSSDFRVEQIASNQVGVTAIAGPGPTNYRVYEVMPEASFFTPAQRGRYTLLPVAPGTRLVRLRVLAGTAETLEPIITLFDGPSPWQVQLQRVAVSPGPPLVMAAAMTGTATGDDLAEYPGDTVGISARCEGVCTFDASLSTSGLSGLVLRHAMANFSNMNPTVGPGFGFQAIVDPGPVTNFSNLRPTRVAATATTFFLVGQAPGDSVRIERRALSGGSRDAAWTSTGPIRVADVLLTGPDSVLVLASIASPNIQFNGTLLPWTPGNGRNILLIKLATASAPSITTWDLPGEQEPVALAVTLLGSLPRLIIVGNQNNDGFLWRVAPP